MRRKPRSGNRGDDGLHRLRRDGGAVGQAWIAARRRLLALADPAIHPNQQSAQQRVVIDRIQCLLATLAVLRVGVGQRQSPGGVLRSGEVVEARGSNRLDVARAGRIRVDQRGIAPPILHEVLVKKIFGTRWRTARRSRSPSFRPLTGSVAPISLNGNGSLGSDADGCPKRMLKSPPRLPPAM